jgi:methylenetetrahydrofolate dehydrogenase (NADP+) / methenyltetrahydrofolate cyclohydrolase
MLIDGKQIARELILRLKEQPKPEKFLGAILIGDDAASLNFLKQKENVAKELGVDFRLYQLSATITTDEARREIARRAGAATCGGCIVQLPLPAGLNRHYVLNAIPKQKDPDLLSEQALGAFYTGRHPVVPPSVATVAEILGRRELNLRELKAAMIGAGFLIGKPVGFWLQNRIAELTVFDEHVRDLRSKLHDADIVISGAGQADLFRASDLKNGTVVIDFGWNQAEGKTVGDFNPAGSDERNIAYTPTPGGTGPILVAKLFENFYALNE